MKKTLLSIFSMLILFSTINIAYSKSAPNSELAEVIKLYKAGNYSECYTQLETIIKNDPANALAYYYKAITAVQLGRKEEAISNYDKSLSLNPANNNLSRYAKKGKRCIENPDKCEESIFGSIDDEFIQNRFGEKSTEEVKSDYERLRIEQLMREINRNKEVDPKKFENYKDFSSVPSNDEIVAALKTLQNAGLNNNSYNDLSILTGSTKQDSMLNLLGNSSMNPQIIQALFTNNISQGF